MINLTALGGPVGRVLRLPLRMLPAGLDVPIVQGPLRGTRWITGASNHGCWLGSYELDFQVRAQRLIPRGTVVYDIGANVGFFTLLFARLVGSDGLVVAFEPAPNNVEKLERHLAINRVSNSVVVRAAAWDVSGTVRVLVPASRSQARVADDGECVVDSIRLDDLIESGMRPPQCLKIDVEGAEERVLLGARRILSEFQPTILLETHGDQLQAACVKLLSEFGYQVRTFAKTRHHIVAVRGDFAYPAEFAALDFPIA